MHPVRQRSEIHRNPQNPQGQTFCRNPQNPQGQTFCRATLWGQAMETSDSTLTPSFLNECRHAR